MVRDLLSEFAL